MNNEIVSALETLTTKLGTTSEYLWNVLLKQAPISAVADLIQYSFLIFVCVVWNKKLKSIVPKILNNDLDEGHWAIMI